MTLGGLAGRADACRALAIMRKLMLSFTAIAEVVVVLDDALARTTRNASEEVAKGRVGLDEVAVGVDDPRARSSAHATRDGRTVCPGSLPVGSRRRWSARR